MRESKIESWLREAVKDTGGKAYKWESPGNAGVPDRIVFMPDRAIWLVELKAPGEKPRPLQLARHRELARFGHEVLVIDSLAGVNDFVRRAVGR